MLFVLGAIVVFLLGGLTGPPNAAISVDLHLHDTYFIVGHFHDTIFGGFVFPFFAALVLLVPQGHGPPHERDAWQDTFLDDDAFILRLDPSA